MVIPFLPKAWQLLTGVVPDRDLQKDKKGLFVPSEPHTVVGTH